MGHMGMIQLVEKDSGPNRPVLQYRDNPRQVSFLEFEGEGFRAVLWGGPDLIATADLLRGQGYRVTDALITDAFGEDLGADFTDEVISLVNEGDTAAALELLSHDHLDAFVQTLTVSNRRAGVRFRLMQYGRVEPIGASDPETLVSALSAT
jgi:hypothetical protein